MNNGNGNMEKWLQTCVIEGHRVTLPKPIWRRLQCKPGDIVSIRVKEYEEKAKP